MKQMVVGFLFQPDGTWLGVRKLKPSWQVGKINGVGGKVEPGLQETPDDAMKREWSEETGLENPPEWKCVLQMNLGDYEKVETWIYFYAAMVQHIELEDLYNDIGERLVFNPPLWDDDNNKRPCIPPDAIDNLHWLVPLAWDTINRQDITHPAVINLSSKSPLAAIHYRTRLAPLVRAPANPEVEHAQVALP